MPDLRLIRGTKGTRRTEYILTSIQSFVEFKYLQFRSTRTKRSFPDFWNKRTVEVWRFIPDEITHVVEYSEEKKCPTSIPDGIEACMSANYYVSCRSGNEGNTIIPFVQRYPDIRDYFAHVNAMRDEYLSDETGAKDTGVLFLKR